MIGWRLVPVLVSLAPYMEFISPNVPHFLVLIWSVCYILAWILKAPCALQTWARLARILIGRSGLKLKWCITLDDPDFLTRHHKVLLNICSKFFFYRISMIYFALLLARMKRRLTMLYMAEIGTFILSNSLLFCAFMYCIFCWKFDYELYIRSCAAIPF